MVETLALPVEVPEAEVESLLDTERTSLELAVADALT